MSQWWKALSAGLASLALVAAATGPGIAQEKIAPAAMQALKDKPQIRVIISTKPELGQPGGGRALSRPGSYVRRLLGSRVSNVRPIGNLPIVTAIIGADALETLRDDPNIKNVSLDMPRGLYLMDSVPMIGAAQFHADGITGKGVTVAVLDTGIDRKHRAFKGAVKAEACFSSSTVPGYEVQSLCKDGATEAEGKGSSGLCPADINPCWHGTHVAGIVAGRPRNMNGQNVEGVASGAGLIGINIFTAVKVENGWSLSAWDSDSIRGLEWVLRNREKYNIVAINGSYGAGDFKEHCDSFNPDYADMVAQLRAKGVAVVFAAGNDKIQDGTGWPACLSAAISVSAATKQGEIDTGYSNVAKWVTIAAPGTGIVSAVPGNGMIPAEGTSMAAPHVAGAIALLKAMKPELTVKQIVKLLRAKGKKITDPRTQTKLRLLNLNGIDAKSDLAAAVKNITDDEETQ